MCFPKNFSNVFTTPILLDADGRLLLKYLLKVKNSTPDKLFVLARKFEKKQNYARKAINLN